MCLQHTYRCVHLHSPVHTHRIHPMYIVRTVGCTCVCTCTHAPYKILPLLVCSSGSSQTPELEATAQRRGYESCFSNEAGRIAQGRRLQSCRQGRYLQKPWLPRLLSEIQRGQIPKVTVKEISDAFTLLKAKVVVKGLVGWGKADELPREERREVFSTMLQE